MKAQILKEKLIKLRDSNWEMEKTLRHYNINGKGITVQEIECQQMGHAANMLIGWLDDLVYNQDLELK
jgi:hypothetical protein